MLEHSITHHYGETLNHSPQWGNTQSLTTMGKHSITHLYGKHSITHHSITHHSISHHSITHHSITHHSITHHNGETLNHSPLNHSPLWGRRNSWCCRALPWRSRAPPQPWWEGHSSPRLWGGLWWPQPQWVPAQAVPLQVIVNWLNFNMG